MPNSQVPRIVLNQDGTISIQVDVYGFDAGTPVEISGQATQENGAVATLLQRPGSARSMRTAKARHGEVRTGSRAEQFVPGFPVTITVRAALAWITAGVDMDLRKLRGFQRGPCSSGMVKSLRQVALWLGHRIRFGSASPPRRAAPPAHVNARHMVGPGQAGSAYLGDGGPLHPAVPGPAGRSSPRLTLKSWPWQ